jgi:hypothetical protein
MIFAVPMAESDRSIKDHLSAAESIRHAARRLICLLSQGSRTPQVLTAAIWLNQFALRGRTGDGFVVRDLTNPALWRRYLLLGTRYPRLVCGQMEAT